MDVFDFYKTIKTTNKKVVKSFDSLNKVYNKIPDTKGCLDNIEQCKGYCCLLQSPQFFYIEFLNIWNKVISKWDVKDICDIIELSMKNYLMGFTTKGCIFFDRKTHLCKIHNKRAFNCRTYGITPEEEFKERYNRVKETYKDVIGAVVKEQCEIVSTIDDKKVTTEDMNKWWDELVIIENYIGILKDNINDNIGGSYRTPHDHVLLYMMNDDILLKLQSIRLYGKDREKIAAIDGFMRNFRKKLGVLNE